MTSDTHDTHVLEDAIARVYDRAEKHGKPEDSFSSIADQWNTWINDDIDGFDAAVMLAQMKLARVQEGESVYESLLDACGYMECAARLHQEEKDDVR